MLLDDGTRRRLSRARDVLELVDPTSPSIPDVARAAGISRFHFIRVFEATFGVTPHQYRIAARVDRAKQLLAAGNHSVTEVCLEVGFSSLGSFSALFHRRVGESPSTYARRLRTVVQVPDAIWRTAPPGCFGLMGFLPKDAFRTFREA
ncbi:MAG: Transcriptional regulator, AraC family [Labilithrix sp.]|nr:Transcriptional regulator, AraC family [Labilithrix sp.]